MACPRLLGTLFPRLHGRRCLGRAVAWLHERGGIALMLQALGLLCLLVIAGATIFPTETRRAMRVQVA
jgi:hypothetical protein